MTTLVMPKLQNGKPFFPCKPIPPSVYFGRNLPFICQNILHLHVSTQISSKMQKKKKRVGLPLFGPPIFRLCCRNFPPLFLPLCRRSLGKQCRRFWWPKLRGSRLWVARWLFTFRRRRGGGWAQGWAWTFLLLITGKITVMIDEGWWFEKEEEVLGGFLK